MPDRPDANVPCIDRVDRDRLLFTLRLKFGEFYVLRTFCPWCAVSAVVIALDAFLVQHDWRRLAAQQRVSYNP